MRLGWWAVLVIGGVFFLTSVADADFESGLRAHERGDHREAFWEWLLAGAGGDARAQFSVGTAYYNGQPVLGDYGRAAEWYERAARQGHMGAQFVLGLMCAAGRGVPQDRAASAKWFEQAAAQGHAAAQHNLGVLYRQGSGVPQDLAQAARWFQRAAEQGYVSSLVRVGVMRDSGEGGPPDVVQAYKWYALALDRLGGTERQDVDILMNALQRRMSPAELAAARQLTDLWEPHAEHIDRAAPVWPRAFSGVSSKRGATEERGPGPTLDRAGRIRTPLSLRERCASYGPACGGSDEP